MAFNTKLNLSNRKMYQDVSDTLTLSGSTIIDSGYIGYDENPDFAQAPYSAEGALITKKYVDDAVSTATQGGINKAQNGLSKIGTDTVELGGLLNKTTTIDGNLNTFGFVLKDLLSFQLDTDDGGVSMTDDGGLKYTADYSGGVNFGDRSLVDKEYVDTQIGEIITDYYDVLTNGLTGATNGLSVTKNVVSLGGKFTAVELDGDSSGSFELKDVGSFKVNLGVINGTSLSMTDDRGLMYGTTNEINYQPRTLVDKAYVDAFEYGITPKTSVRVATTENITLSNEQTVDGVALVHGDRVLVKNQTTASDNGVYVVVDGDEWDRAEDFDFTPASETRLGDLIPVLNGDTQNNTVWALTTFSGGGNAIGFTQFSKLVGISAGDGIDINIVGGDQEISINLDTNSGLETSANGLKIDLVTNSGLELTNNGIGVDLADTALKLDASGLGVNLKPTPGLEIDNGLGVLLATNSALNLTNGLAVDSSIAGSGLSFTNGVVSVNASGTIVGDTIAVKIDGSGNLVVDEDDLPIPSVPVTDGANGLHLDGDNIVLGGDLTGNTVITGGASKHNLTINGARVLTLSGVTTNIGGVVNILDTPANGTLNTDKFLVRDSAGELKQVDFDYTNLTNNKYSYRLVSGVATLLDTDHVILASAGAKLTLPTLTSSDDGLVYKIKNTGGAYASPVEIYGTIDGHSDGMINTDYGSLELMYVHDTGWLTLSFIN